GGLRAGTQPDSVTAHQPHPARPVVGWGKSESASAHGRFDAIDAQMIGGYWPNWPVALME
ncbi:hypothetical protein ABTG83_20310, partial [Acinetobacter baumannii]